MGRQVINPKQTKERQMYYFPGGRTHSGHYIGPFTKKDGYHFSDDKAMDEIVEHFVEKQGFKIKGQKTPSVSNKVEEEDKKQTEDSKDSTNAKKGVFSRNKQ